MLEWTVIDLPRVDERGISSGILKLWIAAIPRYTFYMLQPMNSDGKEVIGSTIEGWLVENVSGKVVLSDRDPCCETLQDRLLFNASNSLNPANSENAVQGFNSSLLYELASFYKLKSEEAFKLCLDGEGIRLHKQAAEIKAEFKHRSQKK